MEHDVALVAIKRLALRVERRIDGRTRVDDDYIARIQKIRQVEEARVSDDVVAHSRDHETHLIAGEPAYFRRLVRRQLVGDLQFGPGIKHGHAASTAAGPSVAAT